MKNTFLASNNSPSFGVNISNYVARSLKQTGKDILDKHGSNSDEFKDYKKSINTIIQKLSEYYMYMKLDPNSKKLSICLEDLKLNEIRLFHDDIQKLSSLYGIKQYAEIINKIDSLNKHQQDSVDKLFKKAKIYKQDLQL